MANTKTHIDQLEIAWGIIANCSGGDWSKESPEWRAAAERFRDEVYHPALEKKDAVRLIDEELQRVLHVEGYDAKHDDAHSMGELSDAAGCYLCVASAQTRGSGTEEWPVEMFNGHNDSILEWPFKDKEWKPNEDIVRNLVKVAVFVVAEINRVLRTRNGKNGNDTKNGGGA